MTITKERLENELEQLRRQEQNHIANLQAVNGAIQFCLHLIQQSDIADEQPVNGETKELKQVIEMPVSQPSAAS